MKILFFLLYIILSIKRLNTKFYQDIRKKGQCYYNDYLFMVNNSFCFDIEKDEKTKDSDNIIYIGIFSLIKEMNNYRMDISGCKTQKIIKNKLKFELSIKNIKSKIKCTIPKLNSTEIDYFDINCKIRKNDYYIFLDDIVLNEIPTLKGYTFERFERYIPRSSRKK